MSKKSLPTADQTERKLHDAEAHGHVGAEAAAVASGAALGAIVGSIAGPPGAIAGALVGGALGAVTAVGLDRGVRGEERAAHDIEDVEAEADRVIESRRFEAPPPKPTPAR